MDSELFRCIITRTYKAIMKSNNSIHDVKQEQMFVFVKQVDQWKMEKVGHIKAGGSGHELIHLLRGAANY